MAAVLERGYVPANAKSDIGKVLEPLSLPLSSVLSRSVASAASLPRQILPRPDIHSSIDTMFLTPILALTFTVLANALAVPQGTFPQPFASNTSIGYFTGRASAAGSDLGPVPSYTNSDLDGCGIRTSTGIIKVWKVSILLICLWLMHSLLPDHVLHPLDLYVSSPPGSHSWDI